jgi:1-acyl-sn-glycerol-3-phosphate acyltransferase
MIICLILFWYLISTITIVYQESNVGWPKFNYFRYTLFTFFHLILATIQLIYIIPMRLCFDKKKYQQFVWEQIRLNFALTLCSFYDNYSINFIGTENIPRIPCIFVSNHQSTLDMAFMTMIPNKTPLIGTAKDSIKFIPAAGLLSALCGTIFIKRGNLDSRMQFYQKATDVLQENISINIFPQGTRRYTSIHDLEKNLISEFKYGAFTLAKRTSTPILPYSIIYLDTKIKIVFSKPIYPNELDIETIKEKAKKIIYTSFKENYQ